MRGREGPGPGREDPGDGGVVEAAEALLALPDDASDREEPPVPRAVRHRRAGPELRGVCARA